jgi:hypothetical protein
MNVYNSTEHSTNKQHVSVLHNMRQSTVPHAICSINIANEMEQETLRGSLQKRYTCILHLYITPTTTVFNIAPKLNTKYAVAFSPP